MRETPKVTLYAWISATSELAEQLAPPHQAECGQRQGGNDGGNRDQGIDRRRRPPETKQDAAQQGSMGDFHVGPWRIDRPLSRAPRRFGSDSPHRRCSVRRPGALSPDGRYLAFVSSRSGNADVWILDLRTQALRNLTAHPRGDFRPAWSPDGEWLAFSSDRDTTGVRVNFAIAQMTDIFVVHRDGSGLRRLTDDHGVAGTPSWSPNGQTIVYYRAEAAEIRLLNSLSNSGTTQIAAVDVKGGDAKTLTDGPGAKVFPRWLDDRVVAWFNRDRRSFGFTDGRAALSGEFQHVDWTPDRRRMIYHRDLGGDWPPFRAAYSRDAQIHLLRTGVFPNYSPDGTRMTMNNGRTGIAHNGILLMRPDGSQQTTLFEDPIHSALAPVWSPRGDRIAFGLGRFFPMVVPAAQGLATGDVAVLDVASRQLTVLTDGTGNVGFPSWSPGGDRIVYRAWRNDASELRIIDTRTRKVTPLLADFGRVNFPSWSPTSHLVQFTSDREGNGNFEIYTIDVATRRITRVTDSPGQRRTCGLVAGRSLDRVLERATGLQGRSRGEQGQSPRVGRSVRRAPRRFRRSYLERQSMGRSDTGLGADRAPLAFNEWKRITRGHGDRQ
jgi:Tol biopolymer transport system component